MFSFRRSVVVLAFLLLVSSGVAVFAQDSTSNQPAQEQTQPAPAAAPASQAQTSVQARIRARRAARREQAIHDTYSHPYEIFIGAGYQRFTPGSTLQHTTMYAWDAALTRYYSERLGITVDGRGNYGTAFVYLRPNNGNVTRPAISTYDVMAGPVYRFKLRPKYSIAGRVMGGMAMGNFSGDTNGFGTAVNGLYPDGSTYALSASIIGEANISPNFSLRLAPEFMGTGFGSTFQRDLGATFGFVYRFGRK